MGRDVLVAVCLERSIEMIVGVLGILKAGGAYLPLDPSYPRERLAFMVDDAKAPVVLTLETLRPKMPPSQAHVITLDGDTFDDQSADNPAHSVSATDLAYGLHVGSTGRPKGCSTTRAVARLLLKRTTSISVRPIECTVCIRARCGDVRIGGAPVSGNLISYRAVLLSQAFEGHSGRAISIVFLPTRCSIAASEGGAFQGYGIPDRREACDRSGQPCWSAARRNSLNARPTESKRCHLATASTVGAGAVKRPHFRPISNPTAYSRSALEPILSASRRVVPRWRCLAMDI